MNIVLRAYLLSPVTISGIHSGPVSSHSVSESLFVITGEKCGVLTLKGDAFLLHF
jgi:hypothetical protein